MIENDDGSVTIKIIEREAYTIGNPGSATVVVQDDDGGPGVSIRAVKSPVIEGADAVFEIITEEIETPTDVTIRYLFTGDFAASSAEGTRVLPGLEGAGTWQVTFRTDDDEVIENGGSVTVAIERGTGYTIGIPGSATVDVNDDDGGPPIITSTAAVPHSGGLPLWAAHVYWDRPERVSDGQVSHWWVEWAREPCGVEPTLWNKPGYTAASRPEFTAAELRELGFRWFTSDDSVHFRVKALFKGGVDGPWSETACRGGAGRGGPAAGDSLHRIP